MALSAAAGRTDMVLSSKTTQRSGGSFAPSRSLALPIGNNDAERNEALKMALGGVRTHDHVTYGRARLGLKPKPEARHLSRDMSTGQSQCLT